ncbi:hypothetical protein PILCRDRAFT_85558 [Piloderma croceum F 1598]|uniref:Uncharacterized protein n=1 Tax=Piloderma croceum (strain F 1598) TaxID=765440 RepID=A0A0C3BPH8_PILCF|nr:hypothetical protein PILCRDRAFT_85558 [Piloderma croceum F 1598]
MLRKRLINVAASGPGHRHLVHTGREPGNYSKSLLHAYYNIVTPSRIILRVILKSIAFGEIAEDRDNSQEFFEAFGKNSKLLTDWPSTGDSAESRKGPKEGALAEDDEKAIRTGLEETSVREKRQSSTSLSNYAGLSLTGKDIIWAIHMLGWYNGP